MIPAEHPAAIEGPLETFPGAGLERAGRTAMRGGDERDSYALTALSYVLRE